MKKQILNFMLAFLCISSLGFAQDKTYRARLTYYSGAQRVAMPNVKEAVVGVSVAAHPKFEFGTRITIPALKGYVGDGKFIVQDRGPAVTSKKASKGKAYVFDIFVPSTSAIRRLSKQVPAYVDVIVHEK